MNEENYYMWLSRIGGVGAKRQELLLEHFKSPVEIFNASKEHLKEVEGLTPQLINNILDNQDINIIRNYEKGLNDGRIKFISRYNKEYPMILKEIQNPPLGIYVIGEIPCEENIFIGIIGSRRCSEYGMTTAYNISKGLGKQGVVIVSGMARGIDSMAHKGIIEGGGKTIAVLGCGIDICYPPENKSLRKNIIDNGCLISEYPPGVSPMPGYFPVRNRIISGLSAAIVVVEAAERSGTLITVEQALEQGRDVFAVPGNVTSKLSKGTNNLIKQGAGVITCWQDIFDNLGIISEEEAPDTKYEKALTPEERLVFNSVKTEPVTVEYIIHKCGVQPQTANYILVMLELKGIIQKLPGQRYLRL